MFSNTVENLVVRHSAARFAGPQGYRLQGDQAHLNAAVTVDDGTVGGADWALQLWACEQSGLRGIKVAELPVGSLPSAGAANLEGWAAAVPPAGQGTHTMVLALASGAAGLFDRIHDLTVFSVQERFCQPSLQGAVEYRFNLDDVEISVGAVTNPRDADNLSGSLGLELWALPSAYEGGAFEGFGIARGDLGCLAGQASFNEIRLSLPAAPLPAGSWQIVLMLREWTSAGFVTRDYANFSAPVVVAERAPIATPVKVAETATPAEPTQPPLAKEASKAPPAESAKPAKAATPSAAEPAKAATPSAAETGRVSINRATAAELAAIKGLTKTVAAGIVAARPYAGLDDVLRAKGMGAKLLEKLRDQLTL